MAPVTIRPARAADLPAVLQAYAEAGIDSPGETLTPAAAEVLLARFAQYPDYTLYVAEAEGAVVGTYALLVMDNLGHGGARSGIVEDVAVLPAAQALGVGGALAIGLSNLDTPNWGLLAVPQNFYASLTKYPLLALPMFVLVGSVTIEGCFRRPSSITTACPA